MRKILGLRNLVPNKINKINEETASSAPALARPDYSHIHPCTFADVSLTELSYGQVLISPGPETARSIFNRVRNLTGTQISKASKRPSGTLGILIHYVALLFRFESSRLAPT